MEIYMEKSHDGEITAFQSSCTFSSQLYFQLRKSLHKIYTILCSTKYKLHKFPPQSTKDLRGKLIIILIKAGGNGFVIMLRKGFGIVATALYKQEQTNKEYDCSQNSA